MRRVCLVLGFLGWAAVAGAQNPPVTIYGVDSSGNLVPVLVGADGTVQTDATFSGGAVTNEGTFAVQCTSGCSGGTSDDDDASIAAGQTTGLSLGLTMAFDGTVWRRLTFGTAGTPSAQVLSMQGVANGTAVPISAASGSFASGAVASGAFASGALAAGAGADGWDVTFGTTTDAKSTATDTTSITAMQVLKQISASVQAGATSAAQTTAQTSLSNLETSLTTLTTNNTQKRIISAGSTEDETEIKATAGVLAGLSCTNNHASANAFIKFANLTAANTTPGTSTVFYSALVPFGGGIVDRGIEASFSTALTAWIVLGEADNAVDEVAANDVHCNISFR